ncbi:cell wall/vacuolar inhibitor of fructosidase 2-like [Gossypium australe]|uniref:Cell wall/vacuolar inhibitor of fructosidase 2-like n=1 Tax=Gossypium australe TaxID=47621 RepID=A0A5B6W5B5_9ROSI|nr:cell wall/vacuolar inhibitor of fructosidase 2-like [Gossypium australe]
MGHRNLVSADDTLIKTQCHNAEVPEACIQCVKSDPQSQSADKVGIAAIVITCISNKAMTLESNMTVLASSVHDEDLKLVLQDCQKELSDAKTNLTTAMDRLKNKDYDQTNYLVNHALQKEFDCKKNVGDLQYTLPTTVLNDMTLYEELSEAVMRIIDRFL